MPKPAWENLGQFFSGGDFAVLAVVHFQAGGTRDVMGQYDEVYTEAHAGEYYMDASASSLLAPSAILVGIKRGDWCVIDGKTYDIMAHPKDDGTGLAILKLVEQQ